MYRHKFIKHHAKEKRFLNSRECRFLGLLFLVMGVLGNVFLGTVVLGMVVL
jgi:hypothetical protein